MSVIFLLLAIAAVKGDIGITEEDFLYAWALFSIADALWIRTIFGRKYNGK